VETAKAQDAIRKYLNRNTTDNTPANTDPYPVTVNMRGADRFGMLVQIIQTISEKMQLNMKDLHIQTQGKLFDCQIVVMVYGEDSAETLCAELRTIQGLDYVEREQTQIINNSTNQLN